MILTLAKGEWVLFERAPPDSPILVITKDLASLG